MKLAVDKELHECRCRSTERAQAIWVKKIIDELRLCYHTAARSRRDF
jgi:hypothetical protein